MRTRKMPTFLLLVATAWLAGQAPSLADAPDEAPLAGVTEPVASMASAEPAGEAAVLTALETAEPAPGAFDTDMQALKDQVLDLNQELFLLEEELLFPANTQVAVFVSMDVGDFFALDSVQLRIDDKPVGAYLYTEREVQALQRGGVHRLYLGNLKTGTHELTATFTGKGPHERDYRRGATPKVEKGIGAKFVELRISDRVSKLQPEFVVREWE
jgi:hypothetical protein